MEKRKNKMNFLIGLILRIPRLREINQGALHIALKIKEVLHKKIKEHTSIIRESLAACVSLNFGERRII